MTAIVATAIGCCDVQINELNTTSFFLQNRYLWYKTKYVKFALIMTCTKQDLVLNKSIEPPSDSTFQYT